MVETDIYIGRQPIFDKSGRCVSYELLYRHNHESAGAVFSDNVKATARVMINLIHNMGLSSIIEDKTGYINVNEQILMSDALLSLPQSKFVFEILEYTELSGSVIDRIRHLHSMGYRFALDDFVYTSDNLAYYRDLFPCIETVKIDLLETHDSPLPEMVETFTPHNIRMLAEKVENVAVFEECKEAGFDLFQGYFFEKPSVISGKKIEPSVASAMEMINLLHSENDLEIVSQKFALYPELTFNLLRYVNSAEFHFTEKITSIRQILALLGPSRIRSWLGLFVYSAPEERPFGAAILEGARFRAQLMREMAIALGRGDLADEAFLAGSLSLADAYLQIEMAEIVRKIHLSADITAALLAREGYLGKLLAIAEKLETTDKLHNVIVNLAPKLKMPPERVYELYYAARWNQLKG